jgi:hypothetical protein
MHQKKLGVIAILCTIALTAGTTYAAIMLYVDVPMSIEISAEWGIGLYMTPDGTGPELTGIDFGTLHPGDSGSLGPYYIMNSGDYTIFLSYSLAGWPDDVTIDVEITADGQTISLAPDEVHPNGLPPTSVSGSLTIYYIVSDTAESGVYSPLLTLNAHNEP